MAMAEYYAIIVIVAQEEGEGDKPPPLHSFLLIVPRKKTRVRPSHHFLFFLLLLLWGRTLGGPLHKSYTKSFFIFVIFQSTTFSVVLVHFPSNYLSIQNSECPKRMFGDQIGMIFV